MKNLSPGVNFATKILPLQTLPDTSGTFTRNLSPDVNIVTRMFPPQTLEPTGRLARSTRIGGTLTLMTPINALKAC